MPLCKKQRLQLVTRENWIETNFHLHLTDVPQNQFDLYEEIGRD